MHLLSTRPGGFVEDESIVTRLDQTPADIVILSSADTTLALLSSAVAALAGASADFPRCGWPICCTCASRPRWTCMWTRCCAMRAWSSWTTWARNRPGPTASSRSARWRAARGSAWPCSRVTCRKTRTCWRAARCRPPPAASCGSTCARAARPMRANSSRPPSTTGWTGAMRRCRRAPCRRRLSTFPGAVRCQEPCPGPCP